MKSLDRLIHELSKLPGIGHKTAIRLALHVLRQPSSYAMGLASALQQVSQEVTFCSTCFHLTDKSPCSFCSDPHRDKRLICVVEESSDLFSIEKTRSYRGLYHVLHGALSPMDGIGPEQLRLRELLARLQEDQVGEIILATNPSVTGDATALYLSKLIKPLQVRVTRLALGLPVGGDIEYADALTLMRALEARVDY